MPSSFSVILLLQFISSAPPYFRSNPFPFNEFSAKFSAWHDVDRIPTQTEITLKVF